MGYGFLFASRMALSCISSEIKRDIGRKSRFFIFLCIRHFSIGGPHRNIAYRVPFSVRKLEWCGYPTVKNSLTFSPFAQYRRVTDGRTDRPTSGDSKVRNS